MNRRGFIARVFCAAATVCTLAYSTPKLGETLTVPCVSVRNPAKIAHQLLLEVVDPNEVDHHAFELWADYCDDEGLECKSIPQPATYHEALCSLSEDGRGVIRCEADTVVALRLAPGRGLCDQAVRSGVRFTVAKNATHPFPPPRSARIPWEEWKP